MVDKDAEYKSCKAIRVKLDAELKAICPSNLTKNRFAFAQILQLPTFDAQLSKKREDLVAQVKDARRRQSERKSQIRKSC